LAFVVFTFKVDPDFIAGFGRVPDVGALGSTLF
jgi:hypothetical protein